MNRVKTTFIRQTHIYYCSMLTVFLAILCSVFMLTGLAGIVLPFIPGVPLAWLGLFIFAIGTRFERISVTTTIVFLIVTVLTLLIDFLAPILGAKKFKASRWGILGASAGLITGIIFLGFWGIIFGPLAGAVLGELLSGRDEKNALKAGIGTFLGLLLGAILKISVVIVMIGFFVASWF